MGNALLSIEAVLSRLSSVKQSGDNFLARCPAHDDKTASLSISTGREGRTIFKCFAGCDTKAILDAINLTFGDITPSRDRPMDRQIVATYDYRDLDGTVRYQVVRGIKDGKKTFRQRRSDGNGGWVDGRGCMDGVTRIPYRLNELQGRQFIYIVEGEKDADNLWAAGVPATTNTGGSSVRWRDGDSELLKSIGVLKCVCIPDNDVPGRKHMTDVEASLKAAGLAVVRVELEEVPIKGDVSDWLASGHTIEELDARARKKLFVVPAVGVTSQSPAQADPFGAAHWRMSDFGVVDSFVHRFGERVRFHHKHKEWLVWNCHHWRLDKNEEIKRKATEHIQLWQTDATHIQDLEKKREFVQFTLRLEKAATVAMMVEMAKSKLPIADDGEHWDENAYLIGCPNGVVDLRTGLLRDGDPHDRITLQVAPRFDPNATCDRWLQFLNEIFCDDAELIAYIRRAVGYSLSGETNGQSFFMCVGSGANGKSTFLSTLGAVFGDYSYTTNTNVFASNASSQDATGFDLAELAGRRLVLLSEIKVNSRMNEQAIKNFTGGEKINAQKKFGKPFEFQPVGKLWMGVNHQPKVIDDSHGFWRRVRLIPFTRIFSGSTDNRSLKHDLMAEAPGILAWAVQGAKEWCDGGLNPPISVMNATNAYEESEDPILEFLSECSDSDNSSEVSCAATYMAYKQWGRDQGMQDKEMLMKNSFGRLMSKRYTRRHTMSGWRYVGVRVTVRPKDLLS